MAVIRGSSMFCSREVVAEQFHRAAADPAGPVTVPGTGPWPVRVIEHHLQRVGELLPDQVAKTRPARLGEHHPQVGITCLLPLGDHLVEGSAQRPEAAGRR